MVYFDCFLFESGGIFVAFLPRSKLSSTAVCKVQIVTLNVAYEYTSALSNLLTLFGCNCVEMLVVATCCAETYVFCFRNWNC